MCLVGKSPYTRSNVSAPLHSVFLTVLRATGNSTDSDAQKKRWTGKCKSMFASPSDLIVHSQEQLPTMTTKITLPLVLAACSLVNAASAFSSVAPAPASTASILENLRSSPLIRASDSAPVVLPDQWRSSTPFGIGDETAAVAFLRHYG